MLIYFYGTKWFGYGSERKRGDALTSSDLETELLMSFIGATMNGIVQFSRVYLESQVVKESFVQYALNCAMGRVGWRMFYFYF